jgi:Transcriptional regulator, AbiEi antitoxin/AbiEi antitoxin C-terminal domain/Protein of unknown function (DUF559)
MTTKTRTAVGQLSAMQHGVVSRRQLRTLGVSDAAIKWALSSERLRPIFRGVYADGSRNLGVKGRFMAAALACGPRSSISHRSAAALLGLLDMGPAVIDVIAPPSQGREIDGIRLHCVRPPRPDETGTVDGIPCTSPARTLVDLAGVVGSRTLRSAFERAAQRGMLDIAAIEAAADPGRRGMRSLRALVGEWRHAAPLARRGRLKSPLEAKILPLLAWHGLPTPLLNAPVDIPNGRIEVDFLWPEHRFVVEADSRDFHATDIAFERDRWRDRELLAAGYTSLRVTSRPAEKEARAIADTIASRIS